MSPPALRPRSVGEILDLGFQLYRRHWVEMSTATGVLVLPLLLLEVVAPLSTLEVLEQIGQLFFLAASAAVVAMAAGAYRGEDVDAVDAIRAVGGRFISVWGAALIQGLLVGLGLMLLVVPGLIALAYTFGMQQAVMVEGCTAGDAFERSKALAKGSLKPILLTSVLVFAITFAAGVGIATALVAVGITGRLSILLFNVALIALNPLAAVVSTVLYYDLRIRKEAYDVAVAAERLGEHAPAPVSVF